MPQLDFSMWLFNLLMKWTTFVLMYSTMKNYSKSGTLPQTTNTKNIKMHSKWF